MASFFEIERVVKTLQGDVDLRRELTSNGFIISNIHNDEYFALAESLIDNNNFITNNPVNLLIGTGFIRQDIIDSLRIGDSDTPDALSGELYKQIFYTYKYSSIKDFFNRNYKLFIPDFDYRTINNSPKLKLLQEAFMREFDRFSQTIQGLYDLVDIDRIPDRYLSYLGELIGFEKQDFQLINDISFRELLKNIIEVYRIKGTNFSLELFINFLGFNVEIREYWFDKRYYDKNILVNPYTQSSNKESFNFYLTPIDPTTTIPEGTTGKFRKAVLENEITETLSSEEFEDYIKEEEYSASQLLGESAGYNGKKYTYFKTNIINYSITPLISENISLLTTQNLDVIRFYINLLTPIFVKSNVSFTAGELPIEQVKIILNFSETLLSNPFNIFVGGEHLDTQEELNKIREQIFNENPSFSNEQIYSEIIRRFNIGILFNRDFVERDLLILRETLDKITTNNKVRESTSLKKAKLSDKFSLGKGRNKRFNNNYWTLNDRKKIEGISNSNQLIINDITKDWTRLTKDDYITITQNDKKGVYRVDSVDVSENNVSISLGDSQAISGITTRGYIHKNERVKIESYSITNARSSYFDLNIVIRDPQRKFWNLLRDDELQIIGDLNRIHRFRRYISKGSPNVQIELRAEGDTSSFSRALFLQKHYGSWGITDTLTGLSNNNELLDVDINILKNILPFISNYEFNVGDSISIVLPEAISDNTPLTYTLTGLVDGLSFNNRIIAGTIETAQVINLIYEVMDSTGESFTRFFSITIKETVVTTRAFSSGFSSGFK